MFIAKISKGRTIKQFINGTLTVPVLYTMIWIVIFGGVAMRQERESSNLGYCCHSGESWFLPYNESLQMIKDYSGNCFLKETQEIKNMRLLNSFGCGCQS